MMGPMRRFSRLRGALPLSSPIRRMALCGLIAGAAMLPAPAASAAESAHPVTLRYLNAPAPGRPILHPPKLSLSINGRARPAVMDTGSTGIVVAASAIPNIAQLPDLGPGTLTYSSSGRIMVGRYVRTAVTLSGADGTSITTRPLPVLAVTRIDCLKTARRCRPNAAPDHVSMLGVGFGREKDHQSTATPDKNPLLNLPAMGPPGGPAGALGRGYIVTRTGVQIGLGANDAVTFSRVALRPSAIAGEWEGAAACYALDGRTPPACGSLLVDTGVFRSFLTVPEEQFAGLVAAGPPVLIAGTRLDISPAPNAAAPQYGFRVGDHANPLAPTEVILVRRPGPAAFFNTSVRFLNGFDYLYDADAGIVGFRPLPP